MKTYSATQMTNNGEILHIVYNAKSKKQMFEKGIRKDLDWAVASNAISKVGFFKIVETSL